MSKCKKCGSQIMKDAFSFWADRDDGPYCVACSMGWPWKETEFQKFHRWYDNYSKIWPIPASNEEKMFLAWDACSKSKRGLDDNGEFVEANSENRFMFNMTNEELGEAIDRTFVQILKGNSNVSEAMWKILNDHLIALIKIEIARAEMMQIKESKP